MFENSLYNVQLFRNHSHRQVGRIKSVVQYHQRVIYGRAFPQGAVNTSREKMVKLFLITRFHFLALPKKLSGPSQPGQMISIRTYCPSLCLFKPVIIPGSPAKVNFLYLSALNRNNFRNASFKVLS